ncbi:MAG: damage-inducible protein D [Dehalococcoidia bacterium]|nr:damage-inducible protein D [Dehalococcoidia bacterium]
MSALEVFHFKNDGTSFEDHGKTNGFRYWSALDLMKFLEYEDYHSFKRAINKAIAGCATLNISLEDNFIKTTTIIDGKPHEDYKLSRFACYLVTINGDNKKPQVAKAHAYFAAIAESFQQCIETSDNVERLNTREEIIEQERTLSGVAKQCGVTHYPFFQNAGYRGLYNMNLSALKDYKQLADPKRSLLDFMRKEELAANNFRITQTELKLKKEGITGQGPAEAAAESVGREVRQTMKRISGTTPEDIPLTTDIRETRKKIKLSRL